MTDFDKVRAYYKQFNEKERLSCDYSGRFEYEMAMRILDRNMPECGRVLDLGGAAGAYSFPLAEKGYEVYLADLSEDLINQAIEINNIAAYKVKSCDVVNALDLSIYEDNFFNVVIVFGPMYHLLEKSERKQCASEVYRVVKPGGMIFVSFIPYASGFPAIIDRMCYDPEQVTPEAFDEVFKTGRFKNSANRGFQEGYYPTSEEICTLFEGCGFKTVEVRSIRGIGHRREELIYNKTTPETFEQIISIVYASATRPEIVETNIHAMYIGRK